MICYGLKKGGREIVDQWKRGFFFRLADRVYVLSVNNLIIFILFHNYEFIVLHSIQHWSERSQVEDIFETNESSDSLRL